MASITYTANNIFYVPPYVNTVTIDCIGGGGAGGFATRTSSGELSAYGGGGGGGTFSRESFSVSSFTVVNLYVAASSTGPGLDTYADYLAVTKVLANGGGEGEAVFADPSGLTFGNGGIGIDIGNIGTITRNGGGGANGGTYLTVGYGGGGGGGAGIDNGGNGASLYTGGTGGSPNGGNGGSGGINDQDGSAGSIPGGGGGGAAISLAIGTYTGGAGARGELKLYYDDDVSYQTFVDCTDFAFTIPVGVYEVVVECWGAGGGGGGASGGVTVRGYGGGAGGGNYSRKTQTVSPGDILYITAPSTNTTKETQGGSAQAKLNSTGASPFVVATGGAAGGAGNSGNIGTGGTTTTTGCIGDIIIKGGNGGTGARNPGAGFSGGGGGAAGSIDAGGNATGQTAGTGGGEYGGNGGAGRSGTADGLSGNIYGGGGGGGMSGLTGTVDGGDGAKGLVRIWYKSRGSDFFNFFNVF